MAIVGFSQNQDAINGTSSAPGHAGVSANNNNGGYGLWAKSWGTKPGTGGISGYFNSDGNNAIQAASTSENYDAIVAQSSSSKHAALSAQNNNGGYGLWASSTNTGGQGGIGLYAKGATYAGQFDGPVIVTGQLTAIAGSAAHAIATIGDVEIRGTLNTTGDVEVTGDVKLIGADCAEHFDVIDASVCDPGTVMVIDDTGVLVPSSQEYDHRVAGVVSGAGDLRPGLILDQKGDSNGRRPIALVGKVYCKADATYGAIEIGDLLTTSPTPGRAMKADDPVKAFGSVIGKALGSLSGGKGLLPVLVALQ
ncbi:MAG: hypothetical protein ACREDD_10585 [Methylocella sp.]